MVRYDNDFKWTKGDVVVFEVDLKNTMSYITPEGRTLMAYFHNAYLSYLDLLTRGAKVGDVRVFDYGNNKVALLFVANRVYGSRKDGSIGVLHNTQLAIDEMLDILSRKYGEDETKKMRFVSGILNRKLGNPGAVREYINSVWSDYDWVIPKKGYVP